jgi:2,3-diaminopropionate biosynthesis protein SbnB
LHSDGIVILSGHEVGSLLAGQEKEIIEAVRRAYEAHANGASSLPHSTFLRFPNESSNRIIALPAYLGDGFEVAGLKWVSSFPRNLELGLDRASAVLILSSPQTGRPEAILEGSIISARRTAASAALAAQHLQGDERATRMAVIGCGLINFETVRFVRAACPEVRSLVVFDLDAARANSFGETCKSAFEGLEVETAVRIEEALGSAPLISLATTATTPHISDLSPCAPGSTILHISLRDLTPEVILANDNIVDDVDHVARAQTSIHLAEQQVGNRDFVRGTLADVLNGTSPRSDARRIAIFSPFGLGVLDLAVGNLVYERSKAQHLGTVIPSFCPTSGLMK